MRDAITAKLARDVATRGGAPVVRVTVPPHPWAASQGALATELLLTPEDLWELVGALLGVASGGLLNRAS